MSLDGGLFLLHGRTALVTGGSRGLGKMIASGLLAFGARVYIASRDRAACEACARELSANGGTCIALPADLATCAGIRQLAAELRSREAVLHLLVNNAGQARVAPIDSFSEEDWYEVMDVNLKAPFFLSQALLDLLRRGASADRPAKILNISSVDGIRLNARGTYSYAASKAGLVHLTEQMAAHLVGEHILVSGIAPGAFVSDMNVAARDHGQLLAARIPAKRIGRAEDIAGAAIFLASRAGDYVVGATLAVDGGFTHALPSHGHPLDGSAA
jgi:NAD(P)-dependent dehydrogenase (short-subunit alcohol dehydrogenase family)